MGHTKKIYNHKIRSLSFESSNCSLEIRDELPVIMLLLVVW